MTPHDRDLYYDRKTTGYRSRPSMPPDELRRYARAVARRWADQIDETRHTLVTADMTPEK